MKICEGVECGGWEGVVGVCGCFLWRWVGGPNGFFVFAVVFSCKRDRRMVMIFVGGRGVPCKITLPPEYIYLV